MKARHWMLAPVVLLLVTIASPARAATSAPVKLGATGIIQAGGAAVVVSVSGCNPFGTIRLTEVLSPRRLQFSEGFGSTCDGTKRTNQVPLLIPPTEPSPDPFVGLTPNLEPGPWVPGTALLQYIESGNINQDLAHRVITLERGPAMSTRHGTVTLPSQLRRLAKGAGLVGTVSFRCTAGTTGDVSIRVAQSMPGAIGQYGALFTQVSCTGATQKVSVPIIGTDGRAWTTRSVFMLVTVTNALSPPACDPSSICQGDAWGTVPVAKPS